MQFGAQRSPADAVEEPDAVSANCEIRFVNSDVRERRTCSGNRVTAEGNGPEAESQIVDAKIFRGLPIARGDGVPDDAPNDFRTAASHDSRHDRADRKPFP